MVRTKRIKHQKRKVYRRKTRGGQLPPYLKNKRLPNPHLPSHLRGKPLPNPRLPSHLRGRPLPEVPNPSPEHSPIHVSPHPPSPLFRRPSHSPPKSRPTPSIFTRREKKPGNLRRTKSAKLKNTLRNLAEEQKRITDIFARGSHGVDNAALDEHLESDN
jgi:hypothetical protein